jgi:hypothetical protein
MARSVCSVPSDPTKLHVLQLDLEREGDLLGSTKGYNQVSREEKEERVRLVATI